MVLAALLFGALHAGGTTMQAATSVPTDIATVLEGLIVLFVAAPPLIRVVFRLREAQGRRLGGGREGVERMTALATTTGAPVTVNRRLVAAGSFILFGLIDILVFGVFSHKGDATFALSLPTASVHVPSIHAPAALVCYVLGAASIAIGIWRAVADPGARARRISIAAVLLFFIISLLCWADAGKCHPAEHGQPAAEHPDRLDPADSRRAGRLHGRAGRRHQHRDRGPAAGRRVRGGRDGEHVRRLDRAGQRIDRGRLGGRRTGGFRDQISSSIRSFSASC